MATQTTNAPSCGWEEVLLNAHAYIGGTPNVSTPPACGLTRKNKRIEAYFFAERPPLPSRLYLRCPSGAFSECPHILRMVDGLILIRVAIDCPQPDSILLEECDYFIYRVGDPSLQRLPYLSSVSFEDEEVGILPRGDLYTVAALVATGDPSAFMLHLLHSENKSWTSIKVSVEAPQEEFPVKIPQKSQILEHCTTTVITLGGNGGTMGWVDLWRGILFCDVLSPKPALRGVPLPLPKALLECKDGKGINLGCPKSSRGIAFVKEKCCLRFVDLDVRGERFPDLDKETDKISFRFDGWAVTTWSNYNYHMSNSFGDWKMDRRPVQATSINFTKKIRQQLREYKLLRPMQAPLGSSVAANPELQLPNLWVSQPTPSMGGTNIVYLMAGAKFLHPSAFILAVDMEKTKLQSVAEFGTEREQGEGVICCPGDLSGGI